MTLWRAAKPAIMGVLATSAVAASISLAAPAGATQWCYEPGPQCLGHQPGVDYPDWYDGRNGGAYGYGPGVVVSVGPGPGFRSSCCNCGC